MQTAPKFINPQRTHNYINTKKYPNRQAKKHKKRFHEMKFLRKVEETKSEESFVSFCSPPPPPDDLLQILLTLASSFIMFEKTDFKVFTKALGC